MHIVDRVEVKQNLALTVRERGKIVDRREGHNIWLDLGREYLAELIAYSSFSPLTPFRDDRIRYMGLGIGGTSQIASSAFVNAPPIVPPYAGTNIQPDNDPSVAVLERPVRVSGSASAYPGLAGDQWIGQIGSADPNTVPTQVTFSRVFTELEVSYGQFLSVPLSEVMLFTNAADPENYQNIGVAYDTFDTLSKTTAFELEVVWTIRF